MNAEQISLRDQLQKTVDQPPCASFGDWMSGPEPKEQFLSLLAWMQDEGITSERLRWGWQYAFQAGQLLPRGVLSPSSLSTRSGVEPDEISGSAPDKIILCSECGTHIRHSRFYDPECGLDGWTCQVCDEFTELWLGLDREFEND